MNDIDLVSDHFARSIETTIATEKSLSNRIAETALIVQRTLNNGRKILTCGNGGSASDAQHLASELVCKYEYQRKALAAIALSSDVALITATGNDYDFSKIFSRQVDGLGKTGDMLIAISTSGKSENILMAVEKAIEKNIFVVGLTGKSGGQLGKIISEAKGLELRVPSEIVAHIQETHSIIIHCICKLVELRTIGELSL